MGQEDIRSQLHSPHIQLASLERLARSLKVEIERMPREPDTQWRRRLVAELLRTLTPERPATMYGCTGGLDARAKQRRMG